jgi:hypothetical protein
MHLRSRTLSRASRRAPFMIALRKRGYAVGRIAASRQNPKRCSGVNSIG